MKVRRRFVQGNWLAVARVLGNDVATEHLQSSRSIPHILSPERGKSGVGHSLKVSLVPQRHHRIDSGRASGWDVAREQRDAH